MNDIRNNDNALCNELYPIILYDAQFHNFFATNTKTASNCFFCNPDLTIYNKELALYMQVASSIGLFIR